MAALPGTCQSGLHPSGTVTDSPKEPVQPAFWGHGFGQSTLIGPL